MTYEVRVYGILLADFQWAISSGKEISVSSNAEAAELRRCLEKLNAKYRPESNAMDAHQADAFSARKVLLVLRCLVEST